MFEEFGGQGDNIEPECHACEPLPYGCVRPQRPVHKKDPLWKTLVMFAVAIGMGIAMLWWGMQK